jgi:hypothetical protein
MIAIGLVLALAAVVSGCSIGSANFSALGVKELRIGMTSEAEAVQLFGEPFSRQSRGTAVESEIIRWLYGKANVGWSGGKLKRLDIEFVDGVANGYIFNNSLDEDTATDFDLGLRDSLTAGRANISDAKRLLGSPHGEIKLPSNLLAYLFAPMPEIIPPEGCTRAFTYNYYMPKEKEGTLAMYLKLLIIFTDETGGIVAMRHFEGLL